jgi:hypothetical protein
MACAVQRWCFSRGASPTRHSMTNEVAEASGVTGHFVRCEGCAHAGRTKKSELPKKPAQVVTERLR